MENNQVSNPINSIARLRAYIGAEMIDRILKSHLDGDPDWLVDMINELDTIHPTSPCFFTDFHGQLTSMKSRHFNTDALLADIDSMLQRRPGLVKRLNNLPETK